MTPVQSATHMPVSDAHFIVAAQVTPVQLLTQLPLLLSHF